MDEELKKFRTRWLRWLGQKTRYGKPYWVTLLNCNWCSWADEVLENHGFNMNELGLDSSRMNVRYYFGMAIYEATMVELRKLDNLYAQDLIEKE